MTRPAALGTAGAAAVLLEALVVGGYGGYLGVESLVGRATERSAAVVMTVMALALAAALAAMARALWQGRDWPVAPVLVWQVLQASIAVPALTTRWPVGVGLLVLCVVAGAGALLSRRGARASS